MAKEDTRNVRVRQGAGEVQVLKAEGELRDANDRFLGYDHSAKTFPEGFVVKREDVSPAILQKLEEEDEYTTSLLEFVSDDESTGSLPSEPFAGYDDAEVEEIVEALKVLPGATVGAVKEYEKENQNRPDIVNYDAGRRESPSERYTGQVNEDPVDAEDRETKPAVNAFQTRHTEGTDVITGADTTEDKPAIDLSSAQGQTVEDDEEEQKPRRATRKAKSEDKSEEENK